MRTAHRCGWFALVVFAGAALCSAAQEPGSLTGILRDGQGKPMQGVTVKLAPVNAARSSDETASDAQGKYRFESLAIGDYTLSAESHGRVATTAVHISSATVGINADLTISAKPAEDGSASAPERAPLEFESAGIRGVIDPGGYSASSSEAATGLLTSIASIERTGNTLGVENPKSWPCTLEPGLRAQVAAHPDGVEENLRMGEFFVARHEPAKAIPFLKRSVEMDEANYDSARALAIAFLESGEFKSAQEFLVSVSARMDRPAVHQLLARANEGAGKFQQAAEQYRIADREQASEESLFGFGYESILAGSMQDGLVAFQAGVQKYPRSIPLRIGAGTVQFLMGNVSGGLESFLNATDTDPSDPRPYRFLSAASGISDKEGERLRATFKRYLDLRPDAALANFGYAEALLRKGDPADVPHVEKLLKRAIELDPNLADAHVERADLFAERGDDQNAAVEYENALRISPDLAEAHYRLAMVYRRLGKADLSAREMQVFRLSKARQADGSHGIDMAQFISVMDAPDAPPSRTLQCVSNP